MSNVLTHHNDNSRTGANLQEVQLTTSNVKVNQFGKRFTRQVDGQIYAQPLCVSNVSIPNQGIHNVVYVATMHNKVYAFDADSLVDLWSPNPAFLGSWLPLPDPNIGFPGYTDITDAIGILSTPVISLQNNAIYVVAFRNISPTGGSGYSHWLHALDLATGAEKFGGPVPITGSVAGTGGSTVTFTSHLQSQRPALLLANDIIYIAFASYGDWPWTDLPLPYHGWVFAYDATTLQQVAVYNTTPNGSKGGIWQGGAGLAADSANNVYFLTGNGSFNFKGSQLGDCGDCIVQLGLGKGPALTVTDWFSPYNNATLAQYDVDLGSGGPLLIPNTNLLLGGGKEGKFYLVNTQKMGNFNPTNDNQIVQSFFVVQGSNIVGGPVYWNGPYGPWVYIWSTNNDYLRAFALVGGTFQTTPVSRGAITALGGYLSISANGGTPGTGIIWASTPNPANTNLGILRAYDASNLPTELWDSEKNSSRDHLGSFATWCPPTIANGKVYMATFSGALVVYGLLALLGGTITEFPTPTAASAPFGITAGPDGNLWFTESGGAFGASANKIGRITPSGVITEFPIPTANSNSLGIAAGPDGNLWFCESLSDKIGRITPSGAVTGEFHTLSPTNIETRPLIITAGPDGNLWFTENFGNKIGRITTSGAITEFEVPTANSYVYGITAGPDGNLWFTESGPTANKIGRITTSGVITEFPIPTPTSQPFFITAGPDGNLWFAEYNANQIGRITTSGVITEFPIPTANSQPQGIATGPDGNLWFTESGSTANQIGRITTSGVITEFSIPTAASAPLGITAGPDGNLWFCESNGNKIGRIT